MSIPLTAASSKSGNCSKSVKPNPPSQIDNHPKLLISRLPHPPKQTFPKSNPFKTTATYLRKQDTEFSISHVIFIHMPETNMALKYHIHVIYIRSDLASVYIYIYIYIYIRTCIVYELPLT